MDTIIAALAAAVADLESECDAGTVITSDQMVELMSLYDRFSSVTNTMAHDNIRWD